MEHVESLLDHFANVVTSKVPDKEAILGSIKQLLSTGR
jgi:hypothetical protein